MAAPFIFFLRKINGRINEGFLRFSAFLVAAMTIIILAQVVTRFVFGSAIPWSEEAAKSMMVWIAFLVAPYGYQKNLMIRLETIEKFLPLRLRLILGIGINVSILALAVILFQEGLSLVERGQGIQASTIPISLKYIYLIVPTSMAVIISVGTEKIVTDAQLFLQTFLSYTNPPARQNNSIPENIENF